MGTPQQGTPPARVSPRPGYPPPQLPHGILGNVAKHYGIWVPPPPPPRCEQTENITFPHPSDAGGKKAKPTSRLSTHHQKIWFRFSKLQDDNLRKYLHAQNCMTSGHQKEEAAEKGYKREKRKKSWKKRKRRVKKRTVMRWKSRRVKRRMLRKMMTTANGRQRRVMYVLDNM